MTSLTQLKKTLESIKSYEPSDRFFKTNDEDAGENCSTAPTSAEERSLPILKPETVERYRNAKENYLRSRITDLFIKNLATYDENDCSTLFKFPPTPSTDDKEKQDMKERNAKAALEESVLDVKESFESVHSKYRIFHEKRNELERFVQDMDHYEKRNNCIPFNSNKEEKRKSNDNRSTVGTAQPDKGGNATAVDTSNDIDVGYDLNESNTAKHPKKLASLIEKRNKLEEDLRKIRLHKMEVAVQVANTKKNVKEMMKMRGEEDEIKDQDGVMGDTNINTDTESSTTFEVDKIEKKTKEIFERARRFREMSDYYGIMNTSYEELGGIKIISVSSKKPSLHKEESMRQQFQISKEENANSEENTPSPLQIEEDVIYLKIKLFGEHVILVTMTSDGLPKSNKKRLLNASSPVERLRVTNATFLTSRILTDVLPNSNEHNRTNTSSIVITIPPIVDLVKHSSNLGPVHDLSFLLRETMARIRSLTTRFDLLKKLRDKYLTKIGDIGDHTSYGHGGEDQEVVCGLNDGVVVTIRLTADFPLIEGSANVHEIIGVGGWDEDVLQLVKIRVNEKKCSDPVAIMDMIVEEIGSLVQEIPRTPNLPRKKKGLP